MKIFSFKSVPYNFSQKGFNMFSAIVAVVLIMTVSVLVGTLVMSEEKTSTQIYGMLNNYQLADAANIARADALQTFNYSFREEMENYLTYDSVEISRDRGIPLFRFDSTTSEVTFDQLQKKFEENILLNTNSSTSFASVLEFVSGNTIDNFESWTYGKYNVSLTDTGPEAKKALFNALANVLNEQGDGFLEVVDCTENNCPKGSFYFNIPLNKLTDEQYESIPRIIVKDAFTQEQIKMAILPKTNLKVYIPLRFFKVLKESMDAAKAIKEAHDVTAAYRLGFCDTMICVPRNDASTPQTTADWDKDCPTSEDAKWLITLTAPQAGIASYFSGGSSGPGRALYGYGAEEICRKSSENHAFEVDPIDSTFFVKNVSNFNKLATIPTCKYSDLLVISTPELYAEIKGGGGEKLYCGRVTGVDADIAFVDNNPKFLVKGTSVIEGQKSNVYKIKISDESYVRGIREEYDTPKHFCYTGLGKCVPGAS